MYGRGSQNPFEATRFSLPLPVFVSGPLSGMILAACERHARKNRLKQS